METAERMKSRERSRAGDPILCVQGTFTFAGPSIADGEEVIRKFVRETAKWNEENRHDPNKEIRWVNVDDNIPQAWLKLENS